MMEFNKRDVFYIYIKTSGTLPSRI